MDELQRLYEHQTMMAIRIYSFLDNLLTHLPSSRTNNNNDNDLDTIHSSNNTHNTNDYVSSISSRQVNTDHHHQLHQQYPYTTNSSVTDELNTSIGDILPRRYENTQTLTSDSSTWLLNDMNLTTLYNPQFHSSTMYDTNNNDTIYTTDTTYTTSSNNDNDYTDSLSKDIQPGGYCEEIFIYLSNSEKQEYLCTICYLILKEAYQCQNQHKFCYGCIYTWSTGPTTGHDSCPVCRCDGLYAKNFDLNERINKKRIRCPTDGCNWMGSLSVYQQHEHRRYTPYELDLLLIDCKKDQMKSSSSSSSSLLPITTPNQVVHNKEIPIKFNDIPQRNESIQVNNNNNSSLLHNNLGQVPTICEPISQSTDQLSETSTQRLLTTTTTTSQRHIRPLRNGNRHRHGRIQNRSILSTSESLNQLENNNNNNNMEETRINNSHGTTINHTRIHGSQGEQHQQRILNTPVHYRRTRSHLTSNTHTNGTINNDGHRQRINVRDSRVRVERLPNLRRQQQIRDEQIQQSITHRSSPVYHNELNSTEINSLLNVNSNDIHSQCVEENFMGDHTELNVTDQHSDNQINLPAIRFNETLTCNLNTQPLLNNSNDSNTQTLLINNSVQRTNRPLEFRRLVPQRQRRVVEQLRETREQLAAMLRLMTMELEERQNRVLIPNLDTGTRNRLLRNPNNLFCENTESGLPAPYVNNTVNRELTEGNNQHTSSIPRNIHRTNVYDNDIQENYYTSQSINSNIPNSVNNNNTRDSSRTLLTPTYREETITNPFTHYNSHNNNNNNNQYNIPVTSTTNITQSSSSPLISTTRLLARLRLNALQQTTPTVFFTTNNNNQNITGNINSSNRQEIVSSSLSLATTISPFVTGDNSNDDNEHNHDISDDETD